jgi:hypothetical protein
MHVSDISTDSLSLSLSLSLSHLLLHIHGQQQQDFQMPKFPQPQKEESMLVDAFC